MNTVLTEASLQQGNDGIHLSGDIRHHVIPALLKQSEKIFHNDNDADDSPEITIDLGAVSRSDSSGVALLIEWMRQADRANKTIRFVNIPTQMLEIAKLSGVDKILAI